MRLFKRFLGMAAGLAMLAGAGAGNAEAAAITFSAAGVFGSTGTNRVTAGDQTITFVAASAALDSAEPGWSGSFGAFVVTSQGPRSTGGLNGETFTLTVTDLTSSSQAVFTAAMSGQINRNQSNADVTFGVPLALVTNGVSYSITLPLLRLPAGGSIDIAGLVSDIPVQLPPLALQPVQVPEPVTLLLFGVGAMLASFRLRRHFAR